MPYEFFDDVAFYFVLYCIIFTFLAPWTAYKLYCQFCSGQSSGHKPGDDLCLCEDCQSKFKKFKVDKKSRASKAFTFCNVLFVVLWIALIALMIQMPSFKDEELTTFEPYTILGIEKDSTESQIKKAYRKESLKWHPDKNPDNADAEQKFIMVAKAYQTLTDPAAKENLEKFGNPDGYQGISMTIGLPSFLTKKENELSVLLLYFLVLIVIPPIGVWMWWSKAKHRHKSGVYRETVGIYFKYVTNTMAPKFLIEILGASAEYRVLAENPTDRVALKKLSNSVKEKQVKQKFKKEYIIRSTTLLYAYLLRRTIPDSMKSDLLLVLEECHRLLHVMLEICFARRFHGVMLSVIALMQSLTQALWFGSDAMLQLPILTEKDLSKLRKKNIKTVTQFKAAAREDKEKLCRDISSEQWDEIEAAADRLPSVNVKCTYKTEDEEGIYAGDYVKFSVFMKRMTRDEVINGVVEKPEEVPEEKKELTEEELIEQLPVTHRRIPITKPPTYAYAPLFPFDKKENWFVYMIERLPGNRTRFLAYEKLATFDWEETVDLNIRVAEAGDHEYILHVCCDSYVGCDKILKFRMKVASQAALEKKKELALLEEEESDEEDDDDEEEEEYSQFWDYLVLLLLAIFAYNWLQSKGYWAQYCTPIVIKIQTLFKPLTDKIYPVIQPYWDPLKVYVFSFYELVGEVLTREFPEDLDY